MFSLKHFLVKNQGESNGFCALNCFPWSLSIAGLQKNWLKKLVKVSTFADDVTFVSLTQDETQRSNLFTKNLNKQVLSTGCWGFWYFCLRLNKGNMILKRTDCNRRAGNLCSFCTNAQSPVAQLLCLEQTGCGFEISDSLYYQLLLSSFIKFTTLVGGRKKTPGLTVITWHGAVKGRSKGKTCLRNRPDRARCLWCASGKEGNALRLLT